MKLKSLVLLLSLTPFVGTALAITNAPAPAPVMQKSEKNVENKDGEMLDWLIVLNKNEIAAGQLTLKKHQLNPSVVAYAKLMIKEHTANLNDTIKLSKATQIKPVSNTESTELTDNGKADLEKLKPLDGADYQTTYIDAMVDGHTAGLEKINADISTIQNAKIKTHIEETAKHVSAHLDKAKEIKDQL